MIYKHKKLQLIFFIGLSGIYIILKYTMSPILYVLRRIGLSSPILNRIDSKINKALLPLTEKPDEKEKFDVQTNLQNGDPLPAIEIKFSVGSFKWLNNYTDTALLIVFVRGSWCSYSRLHLSDVMARKSEFDKKGIKLLGITSYNDKDWWQSKGIDIPMAIDSDGAIFHCFGVKSNGWIDFAWWRILPHESAFLFNKNGILVASDVRKVNSVIPGQKFLSSHRWLEIANKHL
jgi:peroxiredoxin